MSTMNDQPETTTEDAGEQGYSCAACGGAGKLPVPVLGGEPMQIPCPACGDVFGGY